MWHVEFMIIRLIFQSAQNLVAQNNLSNDYHPCRNQMELLKFMSHYEKMSIKHSLIWYAFSMIHGNGTKYTCRYRLISVTLTDNSTTGRLSSVFPVYVR